ncbi:MAG: HAMP domain-containing histidine kinase [Gammaproteobacteria bacterium]|nr:HAMP domain-containing histidine kinase [Gammaproteobacteria bacterium]NNF49775.1 HAMP domain-containing histidine kinase [Woeseiaceae bacterium]MBT8094154.1 HAMP domain-containing histidine kinase [Gammaproteobacteria bacterium]MBT8104551.1 HAMP domain-containing histidine kinase [Gammaproteobacteria bacterium]NNK24565.1 HAMP domain-containing histidine kinase [Woeseiaceae bacterium]
MKLRRPRSLNGLILVGFGLVALPLLLSVIWALFNLDRVAAQSEDLVFTGVSTAENNRLLHEHLSALERVALQYQVLRNPDSLQIMREDVANLVAQLEAMAPLVEEAGATDLAASIERHAQAFIGALANPEIGNEQLAEVIARIGPLEQRVNSLTALLSDYVDSKLLHLQETARDAQRVSAWQIVALVPGTFILILIFTFLVARPISQIDQAIRQLGESGFAKPIEIRGPTDLERLGRQLDWLRIRLLELAQEKNKFLRHMSHELKTPLANIREGTELLLDGSVGELEAPQREVSDILRTNGIKLQQLIENLLSFSSWQTKSQILTLSEFPLRDQVITVAKSHRLALKAAHIQLKLEVDDIIVFADRDKIRTVVDNLLSNAIKFTPQGGVITIIAYGTPTGFTIEFGDTGPGVPDDESPRIFEAFFQGSLEQAGQVGGTGIGLSVVQECVQAHDGSVELVDSDEFPGAHFRIHIPQDHEVRQQQLAANG